MMLSTAYDVYNNSDLVRFCLYLTENKKDLKLKILKMTCDEKHLHFVWELFLLNLCIAFTEEEKKVRIISTGETIQWFIYYKITAIGEIW